MSKVFEEFTDSADEWEAPVQSFSEQDDQPKTPQPLLAQLGDEERELAGEVVHIEFHLPNDKTIRRDYLMGQTVAYLKSQLDDIDGLPYEKTTLFLGNRHLLDPLSLNDLPFKERELNHVTVRITE